MSSSSTAVPPAAAALPADLDAGLRRLKLATVRRTAAEVLQTAKTQRWTPEEVLRTLIEAELAARDASNIAARLKAAAFPVAKTLDSFIVWGNKTSIMLDALSTISITFSDVEGGYEGVGNENVDPLFVDASAADFHLQSTRGHWTPNGFVEDAADSPALGNATRSELGAYGDSVEASR